MSEHKEILTTLLLVSMIFGIKLVLGFENALLFALVIICSVLAMIYWEL